MDKYLDSLFINEAAPALRRHSGHDEFWDIITNYGNRLAYQYAFAAWGSEYIRPNRKLILTDPSSGYSTFNACPNLKKIEAKYFDFSQKTTGATNTTGWYYTFYNCTALEEIEDIGLGPSFSYNYTFANCRALKKIAKITVDEDTKFDKAFAYCTSLEEVIFAGTIGQNDLNLSQSTKLSPDSIMSILNCLKDFSTESGSHKVTFGSTNLNKLTEEEKAIASEKGWDIQ